MNYNTRKVNIRVTVDTGPLPPFPWTDLDRREKALLQEAYNIAASIRRHVDNIGDVRVEWDTEKFCGSCGYVLEDVDLADAERERMLPCCGAALSQEVTQ